MRQDDLTPAELTRRREELESGQRSAMARVDKLVRDQRDIGQELRDEMALLKERGSALEAGEADVAGLIPAVLRRFSKRREVLARRSVAEGLMEQYESVNISLRKATAFTDELRLCAAELQADVERIHTELSNNRQIGEHTAEELKDIERRLEALDGGAEDPLEAERERDRLQFQLRGGMLTLQLHEVSTDLNRKHLDPLRALRNTVLGLHEEMARYVLAATATVDNAGRRIQALGMAADAPAVIAELQESLVDLDQAMTATEAYVARANELLNRVLPELTDSLREHNSRENARLTDELYAIDRERARLLTDRSEQREALAEVESWFDE
jgi:hypothetical protein